MEIWVQASFQHFDHLLHRTVLNVVHEFFQIGLRGKIKKQQCLYRPQKAPYRKASSVEREPPLHGALQTHQAAGRCIWNSSTKLGVQRGANATSLSWMKVLEISCLSHPSQEPRDVPLLLKG